MCEEFACFIDCHIKYIVDTLTLILDFQCLPVIPLSMTDLTWYIYICQEMHLNLDDTIATARLTSATCNIERESSLRVTHCLCIFCVREQITDQIKDPCISCRVRTWASADRRLVDIDNLIQLVQSCDIIMLTRFYLRTIQSSRQMLI